MRKLPLIVAALLLGACATARAAEPAAPKTQRKEKAPMAEAKTSAALLDPKLAVEKAPEVFKAKLATTKGDIVLEVHRSWSPKGADRFYNLLKSGYFQDIAFFRVVEGFMVQFGIHGSPEISAKWREARIQDDPPAGQSNTRGMVSFATAGPDTRTTQMFINFGNNARLDGMGFTPFAKVVQGMDVVDKLYNGYGEGAPQGMGPNQGIIQMQGNAYLKKDFPLLDYIKSATVTK